jgi:hypothetical protein
MMSDYTAKAILVVYPQHIYNVTSYCFNQYTMLLLLDQWRHCHMVYR